MTLPRSPFHLRLALFSRRLFFSSLRSRSSYPQCRFFTSAFQTMAQEYKLKAVTFSAIQPGHKQEAEVEGIPDAKILLIHTEGKLRAVGAKCTHYGAPLVKGVLGPSSRLTCPWHGACFNAKNGDVEDAPALDALPVFELVERDGTLYITGDEDAIKGSRRKPDISCTVTSSSSEDHVLVVGGGSGMTATVEGLRENGYQGPITVVSNEGYVSIDRTKLSKALIADPEKLMLRDESWYERGSIEYIQDTVTDIDFSNRCVKTKAGRKHAYTRLVLATGGTPRLLPLPGFESLGNVFCLRTTHDAKKITDAIGEGGKKIVVCGTGFIGLEIAAATVKNNSVVVVGMEKVPLERVLGGRVGGGIQKLLEGKGVVFKMEASVDKAEASACDPSTVGAVHLKDGTQLEADLVILGVGVAPATEYLKDNKAVVLERDGSLKTDENFAVAGLDNVYAIGDIATYPYHGPGGNGRSVRIEHWNVAQNAGRVVASHIANPSAKRQQQFIPVFWSALGVQLRYCGNTMASGWDDLVLQGSSSEGKFVAYYTQGETVVAMASMGMDPTMSQCVELMKLGKMPTKTALQNHVDLFDIVY